jgi:hypothetical protein
VLAVHTSKGAAGKELKPEPHATPLTPQVNEFPDDLMVISNRCDAELINLTL